MTKVVVFDYYSLDFNKKYSRSGFLIYFTSIQ